MVLKHRDVDASVLSGVDGTSERTLKVFSVAIEVLHLSIRDGRFVTKRSRILLHLVGKSTICSELVRRVDVEF